MAFDINTLVPNYASPAPKQVFSLYDPAYVAVQEKAVETRPSPVLPSYAAAHPEDDYTENTTYYEELAAANAYANEPGAIFAAGSNKTAMMVMAGLAVVALFVILSSKS